MKSSLWELPSIYEGFGVQNPPIFKRPSVLAKQGDRALLGQPIHLGQIEVVY